MKMKVVFPPKSVTSASRPFPAAAAAAAAAAAIGTAAVMIFLDNYRKKNQMGERDAEQTDRQGENNSPKKLGNLKMDGAYNRNHPLTTPSLFSFHHSSVTNCEFMKPQLPRLARSRTLRHMEDTSTKATLKSKYDVKWGSPLGEGGFGAVYIATDRKTKEKVAVKKISKQYTDDSSFQREMNAFLHIRGSGGHPHICGLRENFDEGDHYYLVLDLVSGGEMFDHLCSHGAYSEADAARLVREVGSALAFLHGTGCVHGGEYAHQR